MYERMIEDAIRCHEKYSKLASEAHVAGKYDDSAYFDALASYWYGYICEANAMKEAQDET